MYPSRTSTPGTGDMCSRRAATRSMRDRRLCDEKSRRQSLCHAGFAETGSEGRAAELAIVEKVRSAGIRMVGPNCMGVINTDPEVMLHGTFASVFPPPGNVAMSSQSGALGLAILDYAKALNIGFSTFLSVGNKADDRA